ncbi:MAG: LamG-like jellyroll fold domain-containing protein [Candidatus Saccharibacteria bacterium]
MLDEQRDGNSGYVMGIKSDGSLYLFLGNGSSPAISASQSRSGDNLLNGSWHQVAITVDRSSNTATFYIDGANEGTADLSTTSVPVRLRSPRH